MSSISAIVVAVTIASSIIIVVVVVVPSSISLSFATSFVVVAVASVVVASPWALPAGLAATIVVVGHGCKGAKGNGYRQEEGVWALAQSAAACLKLLSALLRQLLGHPTQ